MKQSIYVSYVATTTITATTRLTTTTISSQSKWKLSMMKHGKNSVIVCHCVNGVNIDVDVVDETPPTMIECKELEREKCPIELEYRLRSIPLTFIDASKTCLVACSYTSDVHLLLVHYNLFVHIDRQVCECTYYYRFSSRLP